MIRKLKGRVSKKIKSSKKKKMNKTLKKMDEIRKKDNLVLRDKLKAKLEWAISERKKAQQNLFRLDGAILTLKDILGE